MPRIQWQNIPFAPRQFPFFYGWVIVVASTIIALQWLALHRTEVDRRWSGKATVRDDDAAPMPAADDA